MSDKKNSIPEFLRMLFRNAQVIDLSDLQFPEVSTEAVEALADRAGHLHLDAHRIGEELIIHLGMLVNEGKHLAELTEVMEQAHEWRNASNRLANEVLNLISDPKLKLLMGAFGYTDPNPVQFARISEEFFAENRKLVGTLDAIPLDLTVAREVLGQRLDQRLASTIDPERFAGMERALQVFVLHRRTK